MGKLEKLLAWQLTKVRAKKELIDEGRKEGRTVHFASLIRGDIVKDNSGTFTLFTDHGSSALQMTAAKVMDIISRLPGGAGQAADAVSAYTQVKMEDAPTLLKIPKSECPDIWIRFFCGDECTSR